MRGRFSLLQWTALTADALLLATLWVGAVYTRAAWHAWWPFDVVPGAPLVPPVRVHAALPYGLLVVPAWLLALGWLGHYRALRRPHLLVAIAVAFVAVQASLSLLQLPPVSRTLVAGFAVATLPSLVLRQALFKVLLPRLGPSRRILLVGDAHTSAPFEALVQGHPEWGLEVVGCCQPEELAQLLIAQPIDEVHVTAGTRNAALEGIARTAEELGVELSIDANFLGLRVARAELYHHEGWAVLAFPARPRHTLAAKRALDVLASAVLLVLLAPVLLAIAGLIRLVDGAPVLFLQERAGHYGRPFRMAKFRTMVHDAEARLPALRRRNSVRGPAFKLDPDPRVTPLGRWLRRFSLDELPQLVHVLTGAMSLVGPRPPLPEEVVRYERWQLRRLSVKPGLTGLWQVTARGDPDVQRWMELDLHYIDHWSLKLDLQLLARTVPAVIRGDGAR